MIDFSPPIRRKSNFFKLIALVFVVFLFSSCYKQKFQINELEPIVWNPEFATPLVNSTLKVDDILESFEGNDVIVYDNNTGLLALKYFSEVFSAQADEIMVIPDQLKAEKLGLSQSQIDQLEASGNLSFTIPFPLELETPSNEEIDSIIFKSGNINMDIQSDFPHGGDITIKIPSLTKNGASFEAALPHLDPVGSSSINKSIADYSFDLTATGNINGFNIEVSLDLQQEAGASAGILDSIAASLTIGGLKFSRIYGDFKQQNVSTGADTIRLRVFDNSDDGSITYRNPRLTAYLKNSFGAPIQTTINTFKSYNNTDPLGSVLVIEGDEIGEGKTLDISFPSIAEMGQTKIDSFSMLGGGPDSNSNVSAVIASRPTHFIYDVEAITNPAGGASDNFMLDTSRLGLDVEVYLPFDGKATDFARRDTAVLSLPSYDDVEELVSLLFRVNIDNGFPIDGYSQVYFVHEDTLTSNFTILDSLFSEDKNAVFLSGAIDGNGRVISKTRTTFDMLVNRDKLNVLEDGDMNRIIAKSWISTKDNGSENIQIYNTDELDLKIGVMAEIKVTVLDSL